MKTCPSPRWLALLALLALASASRATTVIAPDFDSMVGLSDYIVRAVVKSVTSEWRANPSQPGRRYIGTLVELEVREVIKGTPPSPLVLDLAGGQIEDKELTIEGTPRFAVGQESILFVQGNGRSIVPLVGLMHGCYPVRRDKRTGKDQVTRSNGKLLYSEQEVSLPEAAASTAPARNPGAQPLNCADFAAKIRRSVKLASDRARLE